MHEAKKTDDLSPFPSGFSIKERYKGVIRLNANQIPLNRLPIGKKASVSGLVSDGVTRRRMLDLGIIDGTEIEPLYQSPSGNPVAYLIRGAVIALRSDVSGTIMVSVT